VLRKEYAQPKVEVEVEVQVQVNVNAQPPNGFANLRGRRKIWLPEKSHPVANMERPRVRQ